MRRRDTALKMSILAALLFLGGSAPAYAADVSNKQQTISSGTYDTAYGGYTITEGESALQNALTLSGSAIVQNVAAGGWSRYGNANGNTVTIALNSDGYIGTGTSNAVYGGVAEQEGNGTAMHNTVIIQSGTINGLVHGGVTGGSGEASANQVLMSGGTATSITGGEAGEGNANDNIVTLKGSAAVQGSNPPVYGGYSINGNATGNIVNIQADATIAGSVMAGYTRDGTLLSGNKINMTGGTLTGGTLYGAYTLSGFGFSAAGRADTLNNEVTISGGSGVAEAYGANTYSGLAQGNKVTISAGTVAKNVYGAVSPLGDVVDNQVILKDTASVGSGTGAGNVYAGLSNTGKVAGNILYIQNQATIKGTAYGGYQDGSASTKPAEQNQVLMSGGSVGGDIIGGGSKTDGQVFQNNVTITNGTVTGNVYSGSSKTGEALKNTLTLSGGSVGGTLYSGYSTSGAANQNILTVSGGSTGADVYAGYAQMGTTGNALLLSGTSSVSGNAVAGLSQTTESTGNTLTIKDNSQVQGNAAGGTVYIGTATNNTLILQDKSHVTGNIYGGSEQLDEEVQNMSDAADARIEEIKNDPALTDEAKAAQIAEVQAAVEAIKNNFTGTADGNQIIVSGGTVSGKTYGGSVAGKGDATNNSVTLNAGTIQDDIYGGYAENGNALNNTVTIKGGSIATTASLYGGRPGSTGTTSGNSLNFYVKNVTVKNLDYFQSLNFYVPAGTVAGETMLEVTDTADVSGAAIQAAVEDTTRLAPGEVINLIHNANQPIATDDTTYAMMNGKDQVTDANFIQRTVLIKKQDPNTIVLYVPGDSKPQADPGTKVITEGQDAGTSLINEGSDLAVNDGYECALAAHEAGWIEDHSIKAKFTPYIVLGGHNLRYDAGADVDTDGFNGELGFVKRSYHEDYIDTSMPFLEYGNGNFTVHYRDARSDGGQHYVGLGILVRRDKTDGLHYEGMIRAGRFSGDLHGTIASYHFGYNTSSNYLAAHVGLGKIYTRDRNEYDFYGKLYWSRLGSDTVQIRTNEGTTTYELDSVNSLRTRLGLRWTKHKDERQSYYAGLAWEYEFAGKAKAWRGDYTTPSSSLKGSSAFLELGWQKKITKDNPWGLDLRARGWIGKRQGFTYAATISRAF